MSMQSARSYGSKLLISMVNEAPMLQLSFIFCHFPRRQTRINALTLTALVQRAGGPDGVKRHARPYETKWRVPGKRL